MGKEKLVFNVQTLSYEKAKVTLRQKLVRVFGFLSAAVVTAFLLTFAMHNFFPSPREKVLQQEIAILESEYDKVLDDLKVMDKVLAELRDRDAYAFRMVFEMPPIDNDVLQGGVGGSDDYVSYRNMSSGKILIETKEKVRSIKHKITVQSKSLDLIMEKAAKKSSELASLPSIKPVRSDKLAKSVGLLSGFGYRIHPIFKVSRMHYGIDFTAPKGTAIQATGDGVVIKAEYKSGYGRYVVISHGNGYETLYAHMDKILVKKGQKVKRGQQIGKVGSSGTSTAPHCHYEVHVNGKPVNPIQFVLDGLSPKEYDALVKAAETTNQSFD
jgi:hypothetical protein